MVSFFRWAYLQTELWMRSNLILPDIKKPLGIALEKKKMKTTLSLHETQFDIARGNHV